MLLAATLLFAVQDTLTKHLMQTISAPQIVVVRFFFSLCLRCFMLRAVAESALLGAPNIAGCSRFAGCCWRAKSSSSRMRFSSSASPKSIPFSPASRSSSPPCRCRFWAKKSAGVAGLQCGCGFIGTLIILRPGAAAGVAGFLQPAAVIALTSALMFSVYNILTRKVAARDSFETSLLYVGVFGFVGGLIVAPFYWRPVAAADIGWLLAISVTSIISHLLLIKALSLAAGGYPATV